MFQTGFWQLLILLVIVMAIFGPKNLPKLAKMFGKGLREVKDLKDQMPTVDDFTIKSEHVDPKPLEAKAEKKANKPRRRAGQRVPRRRA